MTPAPSVAPPTTTGPDDQRAWLDLFGGDAAAGVLGAALAADGAELGSWSLREVHARPGAEVTAAYEVVARRGEGADAVVAQEHLFATSAPASTFRRALRSDDGAAGPARGPRRDGREGDLGPGVVRLDDGDRSLHVWRHPHDPALPGLAAGSTPARVEDRLRAAGTDARVLSLETVTYRPLRRAVLRARTTAGTVYVKVVRPSRVGDLVRRHALFAGATGEPLAGRGAGRRAARTAEPVRRGPGPGGVAAPGVLTWAADGVVLLEEAPGRSVADLVAATPAAGQAACIDPAEVLRVAAALPRAGRALPRRPAWADRLDQYLAALPVVHDVPSGRVELLGAEIRAVVATRDAGPLVVTHGDLHAANLLLSPAHDDGQDGGQGDGTDAGPRVGAVLDVDTLGPGYLVDDLACCVAHLAVLPALAPDTYAGVPGLVETFLAAFGEQVDPALLRARAAAVVVSLAAGADDAAHALEWLAVAERLVEQAAEV